MRSKILAIALLCLCAGSVYGKESLFKCVDLDNYAVDTRCTSSFISQNDEYQAMQKKLSIKLEQQNPNAMATVQFHPQKMLIKVISHKNAEDAAKLLTAVRDNRKNEVLLR